MEGIIIWETIKAAVIFCLIFDSEPFIKVSNWFLLRLRLPLLFNKLLECNTCLGFWLSLVASGLLQTTTPIFISILVILIWNKINN